MARPAPIAGEGQPSVVDSVCEGGAVGKTDCTRGAVSVHGELAHLRADRTLISIFIHPIRHVDGC